MMTNKLVLLIKRKINFLEKSVDGHNAMLKFFQNKWKNRRLGFTN